MIYTQIIKYTVHWCRMMGVGGGGEVGVGGVNKNNNKKTHLHSQRIGDHSQRKAMLCLNCFCFLWRRTCGVITDINSTNGELVDYTAMILSAHLLP